MKLAVNTNGTEYTKKKSKTLSMCRYWYGIGVVTMRSMDFNASRTTRKSRKASIAARSHRHPARLLCSTMALILLAHAFGRFHASSARNSRASSASRNKSGTRGFPPRSRVSSSSSVTGPTSEYPCRCPRAACRTNAYSKLVSRKISARSAASASSSSSSSSWVSLAVSSPRAFTFRRRNTAAATLRLRIPPCTAPSAALPCSYRFHARSARNTSRNESTTETPRCPSRLNVTSHSSLEVTPSPQYAILATLANKPATAASTICGTVFSRIVPRSLKISVKNAKACAGSSRGRPPKTVLRGPRRPRWRVEARARVARRARGGEKPDASFAFAFAFAALVASMSCFFLSPRFLRPPSPSVPTSAYVSSLATEPTELAALAALAALAERARRDPPPGNRGG